MKPTIQLNTRRGPRLPKTDYSFQAPSAASTGGRCFGSHRPSFRAISQDYFANEAPRHFAHEAGLFFMMVMTVALPLLNASAAVLGLIRIR